MNITSVLKSRKEIKQGKVLSGNLMKLVKDFRKNKSKNLAKHGLDN